MDKMVVLIIKGTIGEICAQLNYLAKHNGNRTLGQIVAEGSLTTQ